MKNSKITPKGFGDYLFEESTAQNEIEKRLNSLFYKKGYHPVVTPALEYLDVFTADGEVIPIERVYKLVSSDGRLLALRPDITLPIARLAATRLQNQTPPYRLCYTEKVFKINPHMNGRRDECTQSGVELLGAGGKRADLEIIMTAARALSVCGATDYKIEIGHAGFFKSLIRTLGTDDETTERIRSLIEMKNYVELDELLSPMKGNRAAETIMKLPRRFGSKDVLNEAYELCGGIGSESLDYVGELLRELENTDIAKHISLDLGLVHSNNYYTGILLRGYLEGSGITVLTGGRYDDMLSHFGMDLPAIGFAVQNDEMAKLLVESKKAAVPAPDIIVFAENGFETKALYYCEKFANDGLIAENSVFDTLEQTKEYALCRGINKLAVCSDTVTLTEVSK